MNQEKTIEVLKKRNAKLQEENAKLKKQLNVMQDGNDKVSAMLKELEGLRSEWITQIEKLKEHRKQYSKLISDAKRLSRMKEEFEG